MSPFDAVMQHYISKFGTVFFFLGIAFYLLRRSFFKYRDRLFARFESSFAEVYNGPSKITKQKLFEPIHEIKSSDWKLKNNGVIRILEIGAGNGANLKHFPKGSHLVVVDKNAEFEPLLRDNLRRFPSLQLERVIHCKAEDMRDVQSDSVDVVVATLVLCSVSDVPAVLAQVKRVLAPGGKFFFLEHVLASPDTTLHTVQKVLSRSRIWPTLFCGCCLDRETGKAVRQAGFSAVDMQEVDVYTETTVAFKFIRAHVAGVATK